MSSWAILLGANFDGAFHERMNVVFDSTYLQGRYLVISRDATDIFPNALFDFRIDISDAVFIAENDVVDVPGLEKAGLESTVAPRLGCIA